MLGKQLLTIGNTSNILREMPAQILNPKKALGMTDATDSSYAGLSHFCQKSAIQDKTPKGTFKNHPRPLHEFIHQGFENLL